MSEVRCPNCGSSEHLVVEALVALQPDGSFGDVYAEIDAPTAWCTSCFWSGDEAEVRAAAEGASTDAG